MKIAIVGVGGVGGVMASLLLEAGTDVALIARGEHLRAIRERGLIIERGEHVLLTEGARPATPPKNALVFRPLLVTDNPGQAGVRDLVIIATKAFQVEDACRAIRPMVGEDTIVLPVQNGLEAPEIASGVVGRKHVLAGIASTSSALAEPGRVLLRGSGIGVRVAELDDSRTLRLQRVADLLRAAGMEGGIPESIKAALWQKNTANAAKGAIGALCRQPIGGWRRFPETVSLYRGLMEEAVAVAAAEGVSLPGYVQGNLDWLPRDDPEFTTSMQRDLMDGRPSELEAQVGVIVRRGRAAGIPTPLNSAVYAALLPAEVKARGS